jgi:hypothetical protein
MTALLLRFFALGIVGSSLQLISFSGHPRQEISTLRSSFRPPDFFRQQQQHDFCFSLQCAALHFHLFSLYTWELNFGQTIWDHKIQVLLGTSSGMHLGT